MYFYVAMLYNLLVLRLQEVRRSEDKSRGASAIEWAIIAGVSVVLAVTVGTIIFKIVTDKSSQLNDCGSQTVSTTSKC